MSLSSTLAERLLAHSRLCRQIAQQCLNEETAAELEKLAEECDRTAAAAPRVGAPRGPLH